MDNQRIAEFFSLADEAKDAGLFGLANAIFCLLFEEACQGSGQLWLEYEAATQTGGAHLGVPDGLYHDLVVVRSIEGGYLCCPAPMLYDRVLTTALRWGNRVDLRPHNRETVMATVEVAIGMWVDFCHLCHPDIGFAEVEEYFRPEEAARIMRDFHTIMAADVA